MRVNTRKLLDEPKMSIFKGLIPIVGLILMSSGSWGEPRVRSIWAFVIRRENEEGVVSKEDQDEKKVAQVPLEPDSEPDAGDVAGGGLNEKVKKVVSGCFCPLIVQPVCGSDGVTYPNKYCVKCNTNTTVLVAHHGACNEDDKLKAKYRIYKNPYNEDEDLPYPCYCPNFEDLVCDSEGDTHYNIHCMKCRKPRMTISKKGPCDTDDTRYEHR